jgi:hypothetical protein
MMQVKIIFRPLVKDHIKKGKSDIYAVIKYKMFPEMEGEFNSVDWPSEQTILIKGYENEANTWEYEWIKEFPYGTFEIELMWDIKGKKNDDLDLKPLPEEEKEFQVVIYEPEPLSLEELSLMHA